MDKNKVCCFTGHRKLDSNDSAILPKLLDDTIAELIKHGVVFYGSGMATGFDTLAAIAVLKAREKNSTVKLIAVLPCNNQDARWSFEDKQGYKRLLDAADKIVYVSKQEYYDGCMAKRNLHLVQNSSICVAYMKHSGSGTSQTVRFSHENGLKIINLADKGEVTCQITPRK